MKKRDKILMIASIVLFVLIVTIFFSYDLILDYMVNTMDIHLF